jgi:hypothetical protein
MLTWGSWIPVSRRTWAEVGYGVSAPEDYRVVTTFDPVCVRLTAAGGGLVVGSEIPLPARPIVPGHL